MPHELGGGGGVTESEKKSTVAGDPIDPIGGATTATISDFPSSSDVPKVGVVGEATGPVVVPATGDIDTFNDWAKKKLEAVAKERECKAYQFVNVILVTCSFSFMFSGL